MTSSKSSAPTFDPNHLDPQAEIPPEPTTPSEDVSWFASVDTRTLQLGGDRWVEIKAELTYREQQALLSAGIHAREDGAGSGKAFYDIDQGEYDLAKLKMWLVDWNATDRQGDPIPCTAAAVDELKPRAAKVILDAIAAYQDTLDARKNPFSPEMRS